MLLIAKDVLFQPVTKKQKKTPPKAKGPKEAPTEEYKSKSKSSDGKPKKEDGQYKFEVSL